MIQVPVNQINDKWSIEASLLTPAYLSNFRPAYVDRLKRRARQTILPTKKDDE